MFVERLGGLPAQLHDFTVAPEPWAGLPDDVKTALVADGDAALAQTYPTLTATAYLAYTRTGDRAGFEADDAVIEIHLRPLKAQDLAATATGVVGKCEDGA